MTTQPEASEIEKDACAQLMTEAGHLRADFYPWSSDEAWRRERLYRFLYWFERRVHPSTNLVGSWEVADLEIEIRRWQEYVRRDLSEEDVFRLLCLELEQTYQKGWVTALAEGTSPTLARDNFPIWDEGTGTLLPANIGPMFIHNVNSYTERGLGTSYNYGRTTPHQRLTIIIYDMGLEGIANGVDDPEVIKQFKVACADLQRLAQTNGETIVQDSVAGPLIEPLFDPHGRQIDFLAFFVEMIGADGIRRGEFVAVRGFRNHFLKVRYTEHGLEKGDPDSNPDLDQINADLAEFVAHFT